MTTTIPARWFNIGRSGESPRVIVIHCTVSQEMGTGAEAVADYFRTVSRKASTHLVSDNNSTVRCVADGNTAYGAAGVNRDGLHIELVGMPNQSSAQWLDAYSRAELIEAGTHIRAWSTKYAIPLRWLTVAQVADGRTRGLCTHADASRAFPDISTGHWDPGPNFPKSEALHLWSPKPPAPPEEPDVKAKIIKRTDGTAWWLCDGIVYRHLVDQADSARVLYAGLAELDPGTGKPYQGKGWDDLLDSCKKV